MTRACRNRELFVIWGGAPLVSTVRQRGSGKAGHGLGLCYIRGLRREEGERIVAAVLRRDGEAVALEVLDCGGDRFRRLLLEEQPGRLRLIRASHGLERAAPRVGDDRRAGRLRLERSDAEILLRREDEGFGALHVAAQLRRPGSPAKARTMV